MKSSTISALSPLDGRYAARLDGLRPLMSEQGFMHRRVQVEIAWFIALSRAGFKEFPALSDAACAYLQSLVTNFSEADALAIKDLERVTNHDVKAVEYWIKSRFEGQSELLAAAEFVHQRRHQQHQPRAAAQAGPRDGAAARPGRTDCQAEVDGP